MKLRPYQSQLLKELYKLMKVQNHCLVIAPTGAGKTAISCQMILDAVSRDRPCVFMVHREELVNQTVATLERFGIKAGVIKAGWKPREAEVQVASVQTIARRGLNMDKNTVVIFDEAHTTTFFSAGKRIFGVHDGFIVGVTATPWRARKTEGLGDFYKESVMAPTTGELIEMGYLVKPRTFCLEGTFDMKGVKVRAGDYAKEELQRTCMSERSMELIKAEFERLRGDRRTIVFCAGVAHAEQMAQMLGGEVVIGETDHEERKAIFDRFDILCSVGVLTEGFDVTDIECVVLARPTRSRALHVQMIGRGLRIHPGKTDCLVLDFAENCKRFGLVESYKKEAMEMDYPGEPGEAPVKICKQCFALVPSTETECPDCGAVFPPPKPEKKEDLTGKMVELKEELSESFRERRTKYKELVAVQKARGLKKGWPVVMFREEYGCWPSKEIKHGCE